MKAAIVHSFGKPLVIEDIPKPTPGPGEIVIKIETSGLCHTDIHAAHGDWPIKPKLPLIPGHEGVGIEEEIGKDVTEVKEGDRVGIPWLGYACGHCEYCASGWETLCEKQLKTSYFLDGGYAEYVKAFGLPADNYVQLPIFETVLNGITVKGSIVGNRADLAETFELHTIELHTSGRTKVKREVRRLEEVNAAFEEVESGKVRARLVFDLR